ncbi:hypothetical protein AXF42_Ash002461 [Apostasia shenzhenica]|uniref:Uncharacterized protein n=1 Tax=Apostasia shenzhenica TaxID=1088818 RepID=A0A2I0ANL3_9ASPA|nr:hypothetical protein AXF42_Ash002461 [Apostasia shenzhenica]
MAQEREEVSGIVRRPRDAKSALAMRISEGVFPVESRAKSNETLAPILFSPSISSLLRSISSLLRSLPVLLQIVSSPSRSFPGTFAEGFLSTTEHHGSFPSSKRKRNLRHLYLSLRKVSPRSYVETRYHF